MSNEYAVVDLFAGPGGLAEGFSSVRTDDGKRPFRIALSVEKDVAAHTTLLLRSFLRQFDELPPEYYRFLNGEAPEPDWRSSYPGQWAAAEREALLLELGHEDTAEVLNPRLDEIANAYQGNVILIGGPPCQAYSLAGRARNRGVKGYVAEEDRRHYLYQEYIDILGRLRPAAFVMENVKGMISSSLNGDKVFERVLEDLSAPNGRKDEYQLVPLSTQPTRQLRTSGIRPSTNEFVIRTEDFGLPQMRHRVIVVGIRHDVARRINEARLATGLLRDTDEARSSVRHVLGGMPKLRSGLSRAKDSEAAWREEVSDAMADVVEMVSALPNEVAEALCEPAIDYKRRFNSDEAILPRSGDRPVGIGADCPNELRSWILDAELKALANNETRSHMPSDFARYFFTALYGEVFGASPKMRHFPPGLAPDHRSWTIGSFPDRFRVQLWDQPSTTVTSHISKDGHYYIHPDPLQCRSLTVREAARLQTFPDNYLFRGNRTQQYVQVGNAVPPFLAKKLAQSVLKTLESGSQHKGTDLQHHERATAGLMVPA